MNGASTRRRGAAILPLIVVVALLLLVYWLRERLLRPVGTFLDAGEAPQKADAVLVLAGGWQGERVLKAGDLVRHGFAPVVYLSGPQSYYERPECDYAIPFAVKHGLPAQWFRCLPNTARSTQEEAATLIPELHRRGVRKCILVSVRSHLRRARTLFESVRGPDLEIVYVGAEDRSFRLEEWYRSRDGKKAVLLEWLKVIALPFEN